MSRLMIWRGCVDLASDGIIPNVGNIRKWLEQTEDCFCVENIEEEINSWFCCLFKQISAAATSSPFLDSAQLDLIRQEAIDSAWLSVKVQIESVRNRQFKLNAKLQTKNKWVNDAQNHKRENAIELKQERIESDQEYLSQNQYLTKALSFARSRIQVLINVIADKDRLIADMLAKDLLIADIIGKDLLIAEKEILIDQLNHSMKKLEMEKVEIGRELQIKTRRLENAVHEIMMFHRATAWQREKDLSGKDDNVRHELLIKKLNRRIKFLEKKLELQGEAPNYPIDLLF